MGHDNIGTSLDFTRERDLRRMLGDAEILMWAQASTQGTPYVIKTSPNPSWKLGRLFLEPTRLFVLQGHDELFEIPLKKIEEVHTERRKWLGKKTTHQLCIVMRGRNPFYIALTNAQNWKEATENLMGVTEDG